MNRLYYCMDCKRVFIDNDKCKYCGKDKIKELKVGKSVNVLGTKQKGRVLKSIEDNVTLILIDEFNNKYLKDYKADELKKIL